MNVRLVLLFWLALTAWGCTRGGTQNAALRESYEQYRKATEAEDLEAVKRQTASTGQKDLSGNDARETLKRVHLMSPSKVEVGSVEVDGERATLILRGRATGGTVRGRAEMLREGGQWKLAREQWWDVVIPDVGPNILADNSKPTSSQPLTGHQDDISQVAYTLDGRWLLSLSYGDYTLRAWSVEEGRQADELTFKHRPASLALAPEGDAVLVGLVGNAVDRVPLQNGKFGAPKQLLSDAGDHISVSDTLIAATAYQKPITLWRYPEGIAVKTLANKDARHVAFSPDGNLLASTGHGPFVDIWDIASATSKRIDIAKVGAETDSFGLCWSPDGKRVAVAFGDSSVVLVNVETLAEVQNFYVRDAATLSVAFSPDGKFFATSHQDKVVYLWDLQQSGKRLAELKGHTDAASSLAFHPDGHELASGAKDRTILRWRASGSRAASGAGHPAAPSSAAVAATVAPSTAPAAAKTPPITELAGQRNRVQNPSVNDGESHWRKDGDATVDAISDNPTFAVRYGGSFYQDVPVPDDQRDGWAVLLARVASDRINADGDITGLPYLYGSLIDANDDHHFLGYLQGDSMRCAAKTPGQWTPVGGVVKIMPGTGAIRLFLNQADGGTAQNGSFARFDDVGVYYFSTEAQARAFLTEQGVH